MIRSRFVEMDHPEGFNKKVCSQLHLGIRNGSLAGAAFFRLAGNHPALPMRNVPHTVDLEVATDWIQHCTQRHRSCPKLDDVELPSRLIYVGSDN